MRYRGRSKYQTLIVGIAIGVVLTSLVAVVSRHGALGLFLGFDGAISETLHDSYFALIVASLAVIAFGILARIVHRLSRQLRAVKKEGRSVLDAKRDAERTASRLRSIIDSTPDIAGIADSRGRFTYLNPAGRRLFNIPYEESLSKRNISDFLSDRTKRHFAEVALPTAVRTGYWQGDSTIILGDGSELDVSFALAAHKTPQGKVEYLSAIARDITERKREQLDVKRQNVFLEQLNKIFQSSLAGKSVNEIAESCLTAAESLTGAPYGFIGEINDQEELDTLAISASAAAACGAPDGSPRNAHNLKLTSFLGRPIREGASTIVNHPDIDYESVGVPEGHFAVENFLGVPIRIAGSVGGVIALANKRDGFTQADKHAVESLSVYVSEAIARARAEEKVLQLHYALDCSPDSMLLVDRETMTFAYVNQSMCDNLGYSREEFLRMGPQDVLPYRRERIEKYYDSLLNGEGKIGKLQARCRRRDGTFFPLEVVDRGLHIDGKPIIVAVARDVADRLKMERKQREQLNFMETLIEAIPSAILYKDVDGRCLGCNEAFLKMLGVSKEQVVGHLIIDLFDSEKAEHYQALDAEVLRGQSVQLCETGIKNLVTGDMCNVFYHKVAYHDAQGRVAGIVTVMTDVTEMKKAEEELRAAKEKAESAARAKSEFLANMSHEIRTPLTAIIGFTETLLEKASDPESQDAAQTVKRNGEHLLRIINDILDISKIEAGKFEVEKTHCSPCQIASETASLMRVRAQSKGLSLNVHYLTPVPEAIVTDPMRLRQILLNLVGNAIKFTESGSVNLVIGSDDPDATETNLFFRVEDTGIGITESQLKKLFKPFSQADSSTTRRFGGTGLGLMISQRLAQMLGGDISVRSMPKCGSVFELKVPSGPIDGVPRIENPSEAAFTGPTVDETSDSVAPAALDCRILLVEDGLDNQRLISMILRKAGADVTIASNGAEALELVRKSRGLEPTNSDSSSEFDGSGFDLILMDVQMPVMDGHETTQALRAGGCRKPIIALSAHAMQESIDECMRDGCDDYLTKPIERRKLLATVADYAEKSRAAQFSKQEMTRP